MKPILVLFATRHGQARRVAERLAARVRATSGEAEIVDARDLDLDLFDLSAYRAALLVSSVHMDSLQPEMIAFAARNRDMLARMPTLVMSVSMSAAAIVDPKLSPALRDQKRTSALGVIDKLAARSGWQPPRVRLIAGALPYRDYNFFLRLLMKVIAGRQGATTDTSRNHELTDWPRVDACADEVIAELAAPPARQERPARVQA